MPQRRNAIKALRVNHKKHMANLDIKTDLKKTVKNFLSLVNKKSKEEAKAALSAVYKKIDKAAKRNIFSKNTAARRKSRFSRLLLSLA